MIRAPAVADAVGKPGGGLLGWRKFGEPPGARAGMRAQIVCGVVLEHGCPERFGARGACGTYSAGPPATAIPWERTSRVSHKQGAMLAEESPVFGPRQMVVHLA